MADTVSVLGFWPPGLQGPTSKHVKGNYFWSCLDHVCAPADHPCMHTSKDAKRRKEVSKAELTCYALMLNCVKSFLEDLVGSGKAAYKYTDR